MRAHGLVRAGAMRKLAGFVADIHPDILAICEIGSGDTRSLATRFALQWAYRGRQAILWTHVFAPLEVSARYLPAPHPFERRGFVRVGGTLHQRPCVLLTTQFANASAARTAQLHFVRSRLREAANDALFFASIAGAQMHFDDLGFRDADPNASGNERLYVRGFEEIGVQTVIATV